MTSQKNIWLLICSLLLTISCASFFGPSSPAHDTLDVAGVRQVVPPGDLSVTGLVWSPESTKLAVSYYQISLEESSNPALFQIQILDIDNGQMELIEESEEVSELQMSSIHAWLLDHRIAFFSRDNTREGTWLINEDGSGSRSLLIEGEAAYVSQDGKQSAFWVSDQGPQSNAHAIYVRDLTGGSQQPVFTMEAQYAAEGTMEWSPDRTKILFVLGSSSVSIEDMFKNIDIYVVDLASTEALKLTDGGGYGSVSWSPDGTLIAYTFREETGAGNQSALYVMRSDGSCSVRIVEPGHHDVYDAGWSPDGRWIAFAWDEGIYILDTEEALGVNYSKYAAMCQ